jgi:hypothetical protein
MNLLLITSSWDVLTGLLWMVILFHIFMFNSLSDTTWNVPDLSPGILTFTKKKLNLERSSWVEETELFLFYISKLNYIVSLP